MDNIVARILGALTGAALAAAVWCVAAVAVISRGDGLTGLDHIPMMLVLAPLVLMIGALWGSDRIARRIAHWLPERSHLAGQRAHGFEVLPTNAPPHIKREDEAPAEPRPEENVSARPEPRPPEVRKDETLP